MIGEVPPTRKAAQMVWEKVLTPEPPVKEAPLKVRTLLRDAEKSSKQTGLEKSWLSDKAITVLLVLLLRGSLSRVRQRRQLKHIFVDCIGIEDIQKTRGRNDSATDQQVSI